MIRGIEQRHQPWARLRAFTLVELLVVVSIIALLIAILLPSLRKAREQAKQAACLANMTGIGKASLTYAAEDPGENMIPVPDWSVLQYASGSLEWGGKSGAGEPESPGQGATSFYGTGYYRGPAHRPLNKTLFKADFHDYNPPLGEPDPGPGNVNWLSDTKMDLPIYRCPSDDGYAGGGFLYTGGRHLRDETHFRNEALSAYDHFGTSYSANVFFIIGGSLGMRVRSQSPFLTPLTRIPSPSESIAYQEWPSRFAWLWGSWCTPPSGCCWANREEHISGHFQTIPGWHKRDFGFAVTFVDGHASMVEMKGCIRPPPNLGLSNYPAGVCGGNTDPYHCDRCVTIRGPGWRLDTLPATSVITPWFFEDE
jgi:prepilin-type N-terminal cleavage/methylation domain-containing protein